MTIQNCTHGYILNIFRFLCIYLYFYSNKHKIYFSSPFYENIVCIIKMFEFYYYIFRHIILADPNRFSRFYTRIYTHFYSLYPLRTRSDRKGSDSAPPVLFQRLTTRSDRGKRIPTIYKLFRRFRQNRSHFLLTFSDISDTISLVSVSLAWRRKKWRILLWQTISFMTFTTSRNSAVC